MNPRLMPAAKTKRYAEQIRQPDSSRAVRRHWSESRGCVGLREGCLDAGDAVGVRMTVRLTEFGKAGWGNTDIAGDP